MSEKRKLERRHLIYYLRIFDRQTGDLLGHLIDLTPEGIMMMSEEPIECNKNFHLRMNLSEVLIGKSHFDFEARSLWCRPDINPDFYDTGFTIDSLTFQDAKIIDQLVDEYGFRS